MKKLICACFLVLAAAAVYGTDFSIKSGVGGILGGSFTRYTLKANGDTIKINAKQEMDQLNYGIFAFFDATYGVFSIFYQNGVNNFKEPTDIADFASITSSGKGWESVLGLSLLGKYPFELNERLTVFPMLGVDYRISLKQERSQPDGHIYDRTDGLREYDKDKNAFKLSDWDSWWINLGGGVDFVLKGNLFLRGELLYGFRLMTSYETKNLELMKDKTGDNNPTLGGVTSGPSIKIAIGWQFI